MHDTIILSRGTVQQVLEALEYASTGNRRPEIIGPAVTALKAALGYWDIGEDNPDSLSKHPAFRRAPQQQAEPLTDEQVNECGMCGYVGKDKDKTGQCPKCRWDELHPLTGKAHQKPLTDDQIYEMYNEPRSDAEMLEFARAIEAAHGIKEGT